MIVIEDENGDNLNYDFGLLKTKITQLPIEYIVDDYDKSETSPQDIVDISSDAFFQDAAIDLPCKYYYELPKVKISQNALHKFLSRKYINRKLQTKNIFLSTDVWNKVVSSKKRNICRHFFQKAIEKNTYDISFSTIETNSRLEKFSTPILTTIHFDFTKSPYFQNLATSKDAYEHFEKIFRESATSQDVDAIYNIASLLNEFSIHKYFLPYGPDYLEESFLLYRYDHSFEKHKNGAMPPLYELVYPKEVCEPHFHFTRGFGSVYKLTSKMQQQDFGVGYAIGISDLKKYLDKLNNQDFKDEKEEKLFMENDFGMPFLELFIEARDAGSNKFGKIIDAMNPLMLASDVDGTGPAITLAYNISEIISGENVSPFDKRTIEFNNPYMRECIKIEKHEKEDDRER